MPDARTVEVAQRQVTFLEQELAAHFTEHFDSDFGPLLKGEFEGAHAGVDAALDALTVAVAQTATAEHRYSLGLRAVGRDNRLRQLPSNVMELSRQAKRIRQAA